MRMNPLHRGISSLAEQISFQASRMPQIQPACSVRNRASCRPPDAIGACKGEPGILSRAIAQVAEVATFTRRH
jgi:hypothetical protein